MESQNKITSLLEKYWEGKTTLTEEKELKTYFNSGDVAPELQHYRALFGYFETEVRHQFPQPAPPENRKRKWYYGVGVAASIAIAAGVFFFQPETGNTDSGKIEDPELALQKTREVLDLLAENLNTGKEGLVYLTEIENTKDKLLEENLKTTK